MRMIPFVSVCLFCLVRGEDHRKPNIILIVADDLVWSCKLLLIWILQGAFLLLLLCGLLRASVQSCVLRTKSVPSLLLHPVKVVIVLEAATVEEVFEDEPQGVVVWPLFESQRSHLLHVSDELGWDLRT